MTNVAKKSAWMILGKLGSRFERLDTSRFRRPLVVPASNGRQKGGASGQLDLFCPVVPIS